MTDEELSENQELLNRVAKLLGGGHAVFDDQMELIMGVLMLLLDHPLAKRKFYLVLSRKLTKEVEGQTLDKTCAVINKTYMMKGEANTINDDIALQLINPSC